MYNVKMVRRTKADAALTRHKILDAAEQVFHDKGVTHTSLQDIAQAAGATRGAIYWHFKDKSDVFIAMMERVTLPLEEALQNAGQHQGLGHTAVQRLCEVLQEALRLTVHDARARRVFEIACHKVEYVGELVAVKERRLQVRDMAVHMTEQALTETAMRQGLVLPMAASTAAWGLHMLVDGLIQNWLMNPGAFDLEQVGRATICHYLGGLGLSAPPVTTGTT